MRRAANSVTYNIAEGFGRYEPKDKSRFYKFSPGSSYERISQINVSESLGLISQHSTQQLISEHRKIINELDKLIKTVEGAQRHIS